MNSIGTKVALSKENSTLTKQQRVARLKFASDYTTEHESFLESVLWPDETKIELFGHNSRDYATPWFGDVSLQMELEKYK